MDDPGRTPEKPSSGSADAANARPSSFDPQELLSRLWLRNLPVMQYRVQCLESAGQHAASGFLPPQVRTEASDIAHKLAGSLGMFGYPTGTEIARQLESLLEGEGPFDPAQFSRLTAALRAALPL